MEMLQHKGAVIAYCDPWVPTFPKMRRYKFDLASVTLTPESLAAYDLVLIATNHDVFDYALVKQHSKLIVDTRGVYQESMPHIVRA